MSELQRASVDGWFAKDENGKVIEIPATCRCGREYTQKVLSHRFMEIVERRGPKAVDILMRDVPSLRVPVDCPACESKALGYARPSVDTWMVPVRRRMEDRSRFAKNMAQLCAAYNRPVDDETSQVYWRALERSLTDDEFEKGVIGALRIERKWPAPSVIAQHAKAA